MMVVERSRSTSRTSTDSGSRTSFRTINSTASRIMSSTFELRRGLRLGRRRPRLLAYELADCVGRLRAARYPVVDAIHLEANLGRLARRGVESDVLDVSAVAL